MNNIEQKINSIDELTPSQKDRENLPDKVYETLTNFLTTYIKQVGNTNSLRDEVELQLMERVTDDDEKLSTNALVNILKILKDSDNMAAKGILDVLKANTQAQIAIINNPNNPNNPTYKPNEDYGMSIEEVQNVKYIVESLGKLINTEFTEEELKKIKK